MANYSTSTSYRRSAEQASQESYSVGLPPGSRGWVLQDWCEPSSRRTAGARAFLRPSTGPTLRKNWYVWNDILALARGAAYKRLSWRRPVSEGNHLFVSFLVSAAA